MIVLLRIIFYKRNCLLETIKIMLLLDNKKKEILRNNNKNKTFVFI